MWFERFTDSTKHFVTNCKEHPESCGPPQQGCYNDLEAWESECVGVSAGYLANLTFSQGDNFTCSEEPHSGPPDPSLAKVWAQSSFAMARTEITLQPPTPGTGGTIASAIVFVAASPYVLPSCSSKGDSRWPFVLFLVCFWFVFVFVCFVRVELSHQARKIYNTHQNGLS
jgi:hypothetical protein